MQDAQKTLENSTMLALSDWQGVIARLREEGREPKRTDLLSALRTDAGVFDFVRDIFEVSALPKEAFARSAKLFELARDIPEAIEAKTRFALKATGVAGVGVPWGSIALLKSQLRSYLKEIILAAKIPTGQGRGAFKVLGLEEKAPKEIFEFEIFGAEVFGRSGALHQSLGLSTMVESELVTHLSIPVATFVPGFSSWQHESIVAKPPIHLKNFLDSCVKNAVAVTLTAANYEEALLLPDLAMAILIDQRFNDLDLAVTLYLDLPESHSFIDRLQGFQESRELTRTKRLGVKLSDKSFAHREQISSMNAGLSVPNIETQEDLDKNFATLLDRLFIADESRQLNTILESEDALFLAFARTLANLRGQSQNLELQLRRGLNPALREVLRSQGGLRVAVPITRASDFQFAFTETLETLARVLDTEGAFRAAEILFESDEVQAAVAREELRPRLATMIAALDNFETASHRVQSRPAEWRQEAKDTALFYRAPAEPARFDTGGLTAAVLSLEKQDTGQIGLNQSGPPKSIPVVSPTGFANEPDTDVTRQENRAWIREILRTSMTASSGGSLADATAEVSNETGAAWQNATAADRARIMRRVALALAASRDRLISVLAQSAGAGPREIDFHINKLIDSVRLTAQRTEALRVVRGADFLADEEILILANANAAFSAVAEAVFAVLATGAKANIVVDGHHRESMTVLLEESFEGGIPASVVSCQFAHEIMPEVRRVLAEGVVKRVVIIGDAAIAQTLRREYPSILRDVRDLPGRGTGIITASHDKKTTVSSLIDSAFSLGGRNSQGIKAIILAGKISKPKRFLAALKDAAEELNVQKMNSVPEKTARNLSDLLAINYGPLPTRPSALQMRALTELASGESWLLAPRQLDEAGKLWSPGIRLGVHAESWFWRAAEGVPVVGIVQANSFDHALVVQELISSGQVAALFTTNAVEARVWVSTSSQSALYWNKPTVWGRVNRTPDGTSGGLESLPLPLAGGQLRLTTLGTWRIREGSQSETLHLRGLNESVRAIIESVQEHMSYDDFDLLRRAALADALSFKTQFGEVKELAGLQHEANLVRYKNIPLQIRYSSDGELLFFARVLVAAIISNGDFTISAGEELPVKLERVLGQLALKVTLESDDEWLERVAVPRVDEQGQDLAFERIRLIGGNKTRVIEWLSSRPDIVVLADPVTIAGSVELFGFLQEQVLSLNAERGGFLLGDGHIGEILS